jgi:UPF0716 protein FxsA
MGGLALFVFLVLPVAEIVVAVKIAGAIGAFATVMLLLAGSIAGGAVVRRAGSRAWRELQKSALAGRPPNNVVDGAIVLLGGLLLLVPGFITDVAGIVLLVPLTRRFTRWAVATAVLRRLRAAREHRRRHPRARVAYSDVIEGEVVGDESDEYGKPKRPDQIGRAGSG